MTLIDTTCWVHAIRRNGDPALQAKVADLFREGLAIWCPIIRLELWNGAGSDRDRALLKEIEQTISELSIDDKFWQEVCELATRCRRAEKTVPVTALLIAACARRHKVDLEHADRHFDVIAKACA